MSELDSPTPESAVPYAAGDTLATTANSNQLEVRSAIAVPLPIPNKPAPVSNAAASDGASTSLRHLTPVLLFSMLVFSVVYVAPFVAREIQYAITLGDLRAKSDMAREQLGDPALQTKLAVSGEAFRLVAMSISPAVVQIHSERPASSVGGVRPVAGKSEEHTMGDGSGIIVDSSGYILTNNHVVSQAKVIDVRLSDGRSVQARVVGNDALTDLAVLKIEASGLVSAPWGDSSSLEVGDWVLALGSPFGLDRSVTAGILSAKGRRRVVDDLPYQDFLQTDAAVNPGNSGGPLVDLKGRVVGINTAILGKTYQGVSFAIPSDMAKGVYERLKSEGQIRRAWLGVALEEIDKKLAEQLKLATAEGALIIQVHPGHPADKAGLQSGDVVVKWKGLPIKHPMDLKLRVAETPVPEQVEVVALRNGQPQTFQVTVSERPGELK